MPPSGIVNRVMAKHNSPRKFTGKRRYLLQKKSNFIFSKMAFYARIGHNVPGFLYL